MSTLWLVGVCTTTCSITTLNDVFVADDDDVIYVCYGNKAHPCDGIGIQVSTLSTTDRQLQP